MTDVDLSYATTLPPEQAMEYFRRRGFTFSWDWHDTLETAHARAFTVAKALRLDILRDIRAAVDKALSDGQTLDDFRRGLEPILKSKGWWGKTLVGDGAGGGQVVQLGSPWRLRTIYQTNLQTSYMAGRYQAMMETVADRPYWQYVAVLDSRTRPAHRALHGRVFRHDDPVWRYLFPPNGWGCRCRVRALSAADVAERGLVVESSEGKLTFKDVPVGRDGEYTQVAVYRGSELGRRFTFSPDPGWSYNPGMAWQEPFTPRPLDPDLVGRIKTVGARHHVPTPIGELPAKPLDGLTLPPHQATGWSEEEYIGRFLAEFDAAIGKPVVYRDVLDDPIVISEEFFRDRKANALKVFRADREMYLPLLADTIKDPVEVWLTEVVTESGRVRLCKRYVGVYQDETKTVGGFVVFDLVDGMWQGTTAFRPRNLANLDQQRAGTLLYTKK